MKVAFTTSGDDLAAPLDPRFGRAAKFLIHDLECERFVVIVNEGADAAHGAGLKAAEGLVKAGAKALVTGECGPKALEALRAADVKIYLCDAPTVGEALALYRAGALSEADPG